MSRFGFPLAFLWAFQSTTVKNTSPQDAAKTYRRVKGGFPTVGGKFIATLTTCSSPESMHDPFPRISMLRGVCAGVNEKTATLKLGEGGDRNAPSASLCVGLIFGCGVAINFPQQYDCSRSSFCWGDLVFRITGIGVGSSRSGCRQRLAVAGGACIAALAFAGIVMTRCSVELPPSSDGMSPAVSMAAVERSFSLLTTQQAGEIFTKRSC